MAEIVKCSYQEAKSIMEKMNFRALEYVPTKEEMEKEILPNIKLYFSFLLWIELTGYETEENKKIRELIQRHLMLEYVEQVNGIDGDKQEKQSNIPEKGGQEI